MIESRGGKATFVGRGVFVFRSHFQLVSFFHSFYSNCLLLLPSLSSFSLCRSCHAYALSHISHWKKWFRSFSIFEGDRNREHALVSCKWDSKGMDEGKAGRLGYRRHLRNNKNGINSASGIPTHLHHFHCRDWRAPGSSNSHLISVSLWQWSNRMRVDIRSCILRKLFYSYHYSRSSVLQSYYPWHLQHPKKYLSQIDRSEVGVVGEFCNRRRRTREFQIGFHRA